jgi:hypothetical protein
MILSAAWPSRLAIIIIIIIITHLRHHRQRELREGHGAGQGAEGLQQQLANGRDELGLVGARVHQLLRDPQHVLERRHLGGGAAPPPLPAPAGPPELGALQHLGAGGQDDVDSQSILAGDEISGGRGGHRRPPTDDGGAAGAAAAAAAACSGGLSGAQPPSQHASGRALGSAVWLGGGGQAGRQAGRTEGQAAVRSAVRQAGGRAGTAPPRTIEMDDDITHLEQEGRQRQEDIRRVSDVRQKAQQQQAHRCGGRGRRQLDRPEALQPERLLIESRWVSKPLAFADKLRPRRLNSSPL